VSLFNRAVVIVVAAAILAAATIVVLIATGALTGAFLPSDWFDVVAQRIADATGGTGAAIIAISVIAGLAMLALLLYELRGRRRRVFLLISSTDDGSATVDRESVRVLAEKTAAAVGSVREAECSVDERSGGLSISCWVSVAMGSDIPDISSELQGKIRDAISRFTGLPVADINVRASYEPSDARRLAVR